MSLITRIDNIPLYSTVAEAQLWASQFNLSGYHQHTVLGQVGYMGGSNHASIVQAMSGGVVTPITTTAAQSTRNQSSSSSGGGGGGY